MTLIDYTAVRREFVFFLRNNDVFTVAQRDVTTTTAVGTFSAATSLLVNRPNVKNVRSVVVASVTLAYGTDYTYNVDYDDSGTIKLRIAFVAAQTGAYTITYDYGTDKIFPDFPRSDLTITSFPRMAVDIQQVPSSWGGFGNVLETEVYFTVVVYGTSTDSVNGYIEAVRTLFHTNYKSFYYLTGPIRPVSIGPLITSQREKGKDKVFQQNIDYVSVLNYEKP